MLKNIHLILLFITVFVILYFTTLLIFISVITAFLIVIAIIIVGAFNIQLSVFTKSVSRIKTNEKVVFLSFDDGPSPASTNQILDILSTNSIKATFFCIGNQALQNKDLIQRMVDEGHLIGSHTLNHNWHYTLATSKKVMVEIEEGCKALEKAAGVKMKLFRPPWGITNPSIARVSRELDLISIGWTIRSLDTVLKDKQKIITRITSRLKPGRIILLHDRLGFTAEFLPELINEIRAKGYSMESLVKYLLTI